MSLLRAEAERIRLMERCRLGGDGGGKGVAAQQREKTSRRGRRRDVFKNGLQQDDRANNEGVAPSVCVCVRERHQLVRTADISFDRLRQQRRQRFTDERT